MYSTQTILKIEQLLASVAQTEHRLLPYVVWVIVSRLRYYDFLRGTRCDILYLPTKFKL